MLLIVIKVGLNYLVQLFSVKLIMKHLKQYKLELFILLLYVVLGMAIRQLF